MIGLFDMFAFKGYKLKLMLFILGPFILIVLTKLGHQANTKNNKKKWTMKYTVGQKAVWQQLFKPKFRYN